MLVLSKSFFKLKTIKNGKTGDTLIEGYTVQLPVRCSLHFLYLSIKIFY